MRLLKVRLQVPRNRRLRVARIYLDGKLIKTVRGHRLKTAITLRGLPHTAFTLKVVEVTRRNHLLVRRHSYGKCYRGGNPAPTLILP
jgi:hypothetical protein